MTKLTEQKLEQLTTYLKENLVLIATCRLTLNEVLDDPYEEDDILLGKVSFESIHLDDTQYFLNGNEIKRDEVFSKAIEDIELTNKWIEHNQ